MTKYIPVIGMEVHVELKTKSKMFCGCKNGLGQESAPNIHVCPVCTGQPGTLPVPNQQAIEFVQLAGLALNCELNLKSKFDRKNYFYPDLPKGYQISQYDQPLCGLGKMNVVISNNQETITKSIGITRIHLEAGKQQAVSIHVLPHRLEYWSVATSKWEMPKGARTVEAGRSSRDLPLTGTVTY